MIPISPLTSNIPVASVYLDPHQARPRAPTSYEDLLGDSIERAFGAGHWELDALLGYLNQAGPLGPNGQPWTPEIYKSVIKTLGEKV